MGLIRTLRVGDRELQADFRPVAGQRFAAGGPPMPFFSPLGDAFEVTAAGAQDVDVAVAAVRCAFESWRELPPLARRSALLALADAVDGAAEELGALDCLDMGKPIAAAVQEAHVAAFIVRWYAECIDKTGGLVVPSHPAALVYSMPVPHGVVGALVSWNYPVINAAMKIAPALAAGNAIVLKPSEHAALSALRLGDLAGAAGLPPGLVSVLPGDGALGAALCRHPGVDMLAFTGSSPTGGRVAAAAAQGLKPLILECGGKNPVLVADDMDDVEAIARQVVAEAFANTGQLCVARSKLIVPRALRGRMVEALAAQLPAVRSGDPADPATVYGPLGFPQHADAVHAGVERALAAGARMLRDGRGSGPGAIHCAATLVEAPTRDEPAMVHEYFAPVLTLHAYGSLAEGIAAANAGGYGLAATVWTRDLRLARLFTQRVRAGQLTVRASAGVDAGAQMALPVEPAGRSGYGVEFGVQALESYSRRMAVQYLGLHALESGPASMPQT